MLHALIGPDDLDALRLRRARTPSLVRLANPLAEQHSIMRPVLYPSMLGALAENVRQRRADPWLFEVGKTYWMRRRKGPPGAETAGTGRWEAWHVAIALLGPRAAADAGSSEPPAADVATLKGIGGGAACGPGRPRAGLPARDGRRNAIRTCTPAGRRASSTPAAARYGSLGEVHPRVAEAWGLPGRPVIAAINLGQLLALVPAEVHGAAGPGRPADRPRPGGVGGRGDAAGRAAAHPAQQRRPARWSTRACSTCTAAPQVGAGTRVLRHRAALPAGERPATRRAWSAP